MFIRCWLHVLLFNSAQQAFTTSWTKPKSWQADKLGSATKMCVYCIELLPLQDGWASLSSVGFHGIHTHTFAHSCKCMYTQSWQDWDICFYFSVTEAAAAEQRLVQLEWVEHSLGSRDDHSHVCFKSYPRISDMCFDVSWCEEGKTKKKATASL